ncbi:MULTISPECIES: helix-turn-helix domain-containing protein [Nocardia]|uniref:helix-turn-helix domain-containing protein n=1 Tax=Nocardia TaxID=1817 RepID=UPI0009EE29E9|nr:MULTISPECIES: helix-turn-helix domain-containing protein [Nocardia]MBF6276314.1 helix-turn-helix domain-containing protein [Nocardia nova]
MNEHRDQAEDEWLTTEEVARRLKVPCKTLATWASARKGPPYARIGRFRRYRRLDLIEWESRQVRDSQSSD